MVTINHIGRDSLANMQPGHDQHTGTAADHAALVIGVVRSSIDEVVRLVPHAQFADVGDRQRHGARLAHQGDDVGVLRRDHLAARRQRGRVRQS